MDIENCSKEELQACKEMIANCKMYEQTDDPNYLYEAKKIADNWNWGSSGSNEGKEGAQKVKKLVLEYEQEQGMSM